MGAIPSSIDRIESPSPRASLHSVRSLTFLLPDPRLQLFINGSRMQLSPTHPPLAFLSILVSLVRFKLYYSLLHSTLAHIFSSPPSSFTNTFRSCANMTTLEAKHYHALEVNVDVSTRYSVCLPVSFSSTHTELTEHLRLVRDWERVRPKRRLCTRTRRARLSRLLAASMRHLPCCSSPQSCFYKSSTRTLLSDAIARRSSYRPGTTPG